MKPNYNAGEVPPLKSATLNLIIDGRAEEDETRSEVPKDTNSRHTEQAN